MRDRYLAAENKTNPAPKELTEPHLSPNPLKDFHTGAMVPSAVRLHAAMLFLAYAQVKVDRALYCKEDLVAWFAQTLKMLESCQTLKSFLTCFHEEIGDFPELFALCKDLDANSEPLLKGIDVFQLLEQLKQDANETISQEVLRIFSVNQAKNARILRLKNNEKAELDARYQCLLKEAEVSIANGNAKAEMAATAWRYFLHNLPELLNDLRVVNNEVSNWQGRAIALSESQWQGQLIAMLDDNTSPYSCLPPQVKKRLKLYLTAYKGSTDYSDFVSLHKSLVGCPQFTRLAQGDSKILRIWGGHLSLSGIFSLPEAEDFKGIDEIQILGRGTIFMDQNMNGLRHRGINLVVAGKTIEVCTAVTINTSGLDAPAHASGHARDGRSFSYSSSGSGYQGEAGKPGKPGGSAGHVHIQAEVIKGADKLHIIANGGKGGDGQHGGAGDRGQDGQDGAAASYYSDGWLHHATNQYHINRGASGVLGQCGGNGGEAGKGGLGGYAGQVVVRDSLQDFVSCKKVKISASPGLEGVAGEPGQGGEAGLDGRRGLDAGVAYTGGFTFQSDQYLRGGEVYAWLKKGGLFTKNVWRLNAKVSEYQVKNSVRTRTQAHGKVGAPAYYKNSAAQKRAINFSSIVQQCPELAVNLPLSSTTTAKATHNQLNQKMDELFRLGERRGMLATELQQVEKEQQAHAEQLKKVKETERSVFKAVLNQRLEQRHQVSQLVELEPRSSFLDKRGEMPAAFVPTMEKTMPQYPSKSNSGLDETEFLGFQRRIRNFLQSKGQETNAKLSIHWQQTMIALADRLSKDLSKLCSLESDFVLSQQDVYASFEEIIKRRLSKEKLFSLEELTRGLYEAGVWYAYDPYFVDQALSQKKDLLQSLLVQPQLLIEQGYRRLKLALTFMRLEPADLDELRQHCSNAPLIQRQLQHYYRDNFYQDRKKAVLIRFAKLAPATKQAVSALIDNIIFATETVGPRGSYAKSLRMIDSLLLIMTQSNELNTMQSQLFELLEGCGQDNEGMVDENNLAIGPSAAKAKHQPVSEEDNFRHLLALSFSSNVYVPGSAAFVQAQNELVNFIETKSADPAWRAIFDHLWQNIAGIEILPPLEEVKLLLSIMAEREKVASLLAELSGKDLSCWGSIVLLGNTKEKLRGLVRCQATENITELGDEFAQKVDILICQPAILYIFYQKLAEEVTLFEPKLALSIIELRKILYALENLIKGEHDEDFLAALQATPLPGWDRLLRERALQVFLFTDSQSQNDQKRCLFLLGKLEESLGRQKIDRLSACIPKTGKAMNYSLLADLLRQLHYQQFTVDEDCLVLLEQTPFAQWASVLANYHRKEIKKPRNLQVLVSLMQNEVANKHMEILFSKDNNPPEIIRQIENIQGQLHGDFHPLSAFLFQDKEDKEIAEYFAKTAIGAWTEKDILAWSKAFRNQPEGRRLVSEHLAEIVAVIARTVFLEKDFYPREVQYLALLTAFEGSNHAQKMISQLATGQGKTMTGTMLALLRVFAGDRVDFVTSSSVLAEETEEEIQSVCKLFGVSSACNTDSQDGPYPLELIAGELSMAQKEAFCSKKGIAIIKKEGKYLLGLVGMSDNGFYEHPLDLSNWPELQKKLGDKPFISRKCTVSDRLHEEVSRILRYEGFAGCIAEHKNETEKLQNSYRSDILCGDLQSFMRAQLLTEFYGKDLTQNRKAFVIMDEVDRLLDEMRDTLYLSHDIPDMHHLNNLLVAIWEAVHHPSCAEDIEENIAGLTNYFLTKLSPGSCSSAELLQGKIRIPIQLNAFACRRLETWVRSAYFAKNSLARDGEYIVAQMGEEERKGVYLVEKDTGVTSRNKELAHGVHQFLRLKHQGWPNPLSLKAIYSDPVSFLQENYQNGFFGMSGTLGTEQDASYFEKLFAIHKKCIIPRHELLNLQVESPILVSSFDEQMSEVAKLVHNLAVLSCQAVEIICDSIADAKAITAFLQEQVSETRIYTRIHSFEPFSKGSRQDPIKAGEVIVTTAISGRGTDFHLDSQAERDGLCLIKLGVAKHERADRQADGRTARKGLPGRLVHVLCPQHGESSLEEMEARRDLLQEQALDRLRQKELHQNSINRQLFAVFSQLAREVESIIRKTEPGKNTWAQGYVERQMAALRTHWAIWLDEAEQQLENGRCKGVDELYTQFQEFRSNMVAAAQDKGPIKLVNGAGEITGLGLWFSLENLSTLAQECFDRVIQDFYSFSGQALYYKAYTLLRTANADDFVVRKEAASYLKGARSLLKKELESLMEPVDRMVALDTFLSKQGQGLEDSSFKKTVNGQAQSQLVHLGAIDQLIGTVTDPSFFLADTDDKEEAENLFKRLIEKFDLKGYRFSKKVSLANAQRLQILLINGKSQELKFPAELDDYKDKIFDLITIRQGRKRKLRTLSYEEFCILVFGEEEASAADPKKMAMKLGWHFLVQEQVIKQPALNRSRLEKLSLKKKAHSKGFSESAWTRAGGLLRIYDEIELGTEGIQNLAERGQIPMDVLSFFKHSLEFDQVIRVDKKPVRWSWGATLVLCWSVAQIATGILLACPALVQQGIGDMVFLAMSAIRGDFSMENYLRQKRIAITSAALTIAGKATLDWVIKAAEKYKMGQDAARFMTLNVQNTESSLPQAIITRTVDMAMPQQTVAVTQQSSTFLSFARKIVDGIPAPRLVQHSDLSFASQFGSAVGEAFKQAAAQATMHYCIASFSQADIERNAHETLGEQLQLELDALSADIKRLSLEILEFSESAEQAERIIQSIFAETLSEHQQEKIEPLKDSISLLLNGNTAAIVGSQIADWTGKGKLGKLTEFVLANLDKIGLIARSLTIAKNLMAEMKKNLSQKCDKLKTSKQPSTRTPTEIAKFASLLDGKLRQLKARVGNEALRNIANTVIKPLVSWTWQLLIDFVASQLDKAKHAAVKAQSRPQALKETEDADPILTSANLLTPPSPKEGTLLAVLAKRLSREELEQLFNRIPYEKFSALRDVIGEIDGKKLMYYMGGGVRKNSYYHNGCIRNTCTLRTCLALFLAGIPIPKDPDGKTISFLIKESEKSQASSLAEKNNIADLRRYLLDCIKSTYSAQEESSPPDQVHRCWAYYRVRDLDAYLRKIWGEPIRVTKENMQDFSNLRGLCIVKLAPPHTSYTGHAENFDDSLFVQFYEAQDQVLVWPLPTVELRAEYDALLREEHLYAERLKEEERRQAAANSKAPDQDNQVATRRRPSFFFPVLQQTILPWEQSSASNLLPQHEST